MQTIKNKKTQQARYFLRVMGEGSAMGTAWLCIGNTSSESQGRYPPWSRLFALYFVPLWAASVECISLTFAFVYFFWRK